MSADEAKSIAASMVTLWQREVPATTRVLAAVSNREREHRPHPKSRSAWELASHIAMSSVWFIDSISNGHFSFDSRSEAEAESSFNSVADVVAFYEQHVPSKLAALLEHSGDVLSQPIDFFGMNQSRAAWIGFANNHSIHHRGQLSAYLRSMGCTVPDIYGPSADSANASA